MAAQIVISLDQSTRCTGWALFVDNKLVKSGQKNLIDYGNDYIDRIVMIRRWLVRIFEEYSDIHLVIEDVLHQQNGDTFAKLANLQGVILELAREYHIPTSIVHPQTWKSTIHIAGKGRTREKELSRQFVLDNYNIKAKEDEADAICIGYEYLCENVNEWS